MAYSWTNLGSGVNSDVYALALDTNNNLYVGGDFTAAGGISAIRVAKWNGASWTNLGSGLNNYVQAIDFDTNGNLYAGGSFTTAGGGSANYVAKWNGTAWTNLGTGMNDAVWALAYDPNGNLYAGGRFTNAGEVVASNIARWNGTFWTNLNVGMNGYVQALADDTNGNLYASGRFTVAGGVAANRIARWNGTSWTNLGSGMNNWVMAMVLNTNGSLYAGGNFSTAGGISASRIAYWRDEPAPNMLILGTNDAVIASGASASSALGTDFGSIFWGSVLTNVFSITNIGSASLTISAWTTNGPGASQFRAAGIPAVVSIGGASNFSITFAPAEGGTNSASFSIVNNSTSTPYVVNIRGNGSPHDQTISFPAIADQVATAAVSLSATASSSLPVSFSVASGPGTISGGATLTFTGAGAVSIIASQAGNSSWNAAPNVTNTLTVSKANQTITFPAIADQIVTAIVTLSATSGSGLGVSFAVGSGPASIAGGNLCSFSSAGNVSIVASQSGNNNWNAAPSVTNSFTVTGVSTSSAIISSGVCADYDGDRLADPAVYDEATGTWKVKLSSAGYYLIITTLNNLGGPGLASVSADYDGDAKADPAVYRGSSGVWTILKSSLNYAVWVFPQTLGGPGYSGMPADYDGDHLADPGVYQRTEGDWRVLLSAAGYYPVELLGFLGGTGYWAVAADYDGDMKSDPAIYGESNGVWAIKISSANYLTLILAQTLGGAGYVPVPADYDGDDLADPAVKSVNGNEWIVMFSSGGYTPVYLTIAFE